MIYFIVRCSCWILAFSLYKNNNVDHLSNMWILPSSQAYQMEIDHVFPFTACTFCARPIIDNQFITLNWDCLIDVPIFIFWLEMIKVPHILQNEWGLTCYKFLSSVIYLQQHYPQPRQYIFCTPYMHCSCWLVISQRKHKPKCFNNIAHGPFRWTIMMTIKFTKCSLNKDFREQFLKVDLGSIFP